MNFSKRKIANFRKWNEDRRIRLNVNAYYLSMYSAKGKKKNPEKFTSGIKILSIFPLYLVRIKRSRYFICSDLAITFGHITKKPKTNHTFLSSL